MTIRIDRSPEACIKRLPALTDRENRVILAALFVTAQMLPKNGRRPELIKLLIKLSAPKRMVRSLEGIRR